MQGASSGFFTPNTSPSKRPAPVCLIALCETPPPLHKRQRLFSPSSPATPDKFPAYFRSPVRPSPISPRPTLDSSVDSMTALNEMAAHEVCSNDVMVTSPPRLERLRLLDYPRTPLSIARSSGLQVLPANDVPQEENHKLSQSRGKSYSR